MNVLRRISVISITSNGRNEKTVLWALIGGFMSVLALQPYTFGISIGFSWQIVIGTIIAFLIMQTGKSNT